MKQDGILLGNSSSSKRLLSRSICHDSRDENVVK